MQQILSHSTLSIKQSHMHVMHAHIVQIMLTNHILCIIECQLVSQLPYKVYVMTYTSAMSLKSNPQ